MHRIRHLTGILILAILLSACAPAAASPTPVPPTATSQPTAPLAPSPTAEAAPTEAGVTPTETSAPNAGEKTTFVVNSSETTVSYSVDETFLNQNNKLATAVGTTSQVTGQFEVDLANPADITFGEFSVDISTLKSDSGRRDSAIQGNWLESARFPMARFTVKELVNFPADPQPNQALQFQMAGDLTIREATRPVTWDVSATYDGSRLTGTATTFIMMEEWGVPPPNIAGVLIVKDGVTLTLNFTFDPQS